MDIDVAVVPVAGLGTRLLPATKSQPKEMLPVGRKPVVQYVCEELTGAGLKRILFITGPGKTSLENHFDVNEELVQLLRENGKEELLTSLAFERADVQYFYTRQRRALGLGHAVLAARAYARAALVGNPSDGYHGRTISLVVGNFSAEVVLYEWDTVEIMLTEEDRARFRSVHDLARDVALHGYYGGIRLIKATIKRFVD